MVKANSFQRISHTLKSIFMLTVLGENQKLKTKVQYLHRNNTNLKKQADDKTFKLLLANQKIFAVRYPNCCHKIFFNFST